MRTIWRDRISRGSGEPVGRYVLYVTDGIDGKPTPVTLRWAMTEIRAGRAKLIDKFNVRLTDDITEPPVTFSFEALQTLTGPLARARRSKTMNDNTEWCRTHFGMLAEGGKWAIPRAGIIFTRRGNRLVLTDRMPHDPQMPITKEELEAQQESEFELNRREFARAGIEVVKE